MGAVNFMQVMAKAAKVKLYFRVWDRMYLDCPHSACFVEAVKGLP